MKAALFAALVPRPRVLLMDEPFTGMDVAVKDELVRGLLSSARDDGWSVIISSHDLAELEPLADWTGFLDAGQLRLSEPTEELFRRFRRIEARGVVPSDVQAVHRSDWLSVDLGGARVSFIMRVEPAADDEAIVRSLSFPDGVSVDVRSASLREIFIALANETRPSTDHTPNSAEEARA